jgi:hypothetical protein
MTARPHVVVLHRWVDRYAEYERYLDHDRYAVSYVTTEVGVPGVPAAAAEIALVVATDDVPAVADQVKWLAERHGDPAAIVALKEDDLLVAARLRAEWGCPGPSVSQLLPFRDKLVMAEIVSEAGLAVPAFAAAPDSESLRAFGGRHGWPVITKPRVGSASDGVSKLDGPRDVRYVVFDPDRPLMAQAFDARQIYHVDGLFDGVDIGPLRISRYVNTCLGFRGGEVLGSVEADDPRLVEAISDFSARTLSCLGDTPTVFHLEVFADEATGECAFLEVGARVGGAEIPFLWREVHGFDLMEAAFRLSLGAAPSQWPARLGRGAVAAWSERAGWLLVPAPAQRPCVISEATPMVGRVPGPYAEVLLRPGEVLPAADAFYEHVGGRFRFRGGSSAEVLAAITATARDFRVC